LQDLSPLIADIAILELNLFDVWVGPSSYLEIVLQEVVVTYFASVELQPFEGFVATEHQEQAAERLAVDLVFGKV